MKDTYPHAGEVGRSHGLGRVHAKTRKAGGKPRRSMLLEKTKQGEPGGGRHGWAGRVTAVTWSDDWTPK